MKLKILILGFVLAFTTMAIIGCGSASTTSNPTTTTNPSTDPSNPTTSSTLESYDIGTPTLQDIWVSPTGNDTNSGASSSAALKTIPAAIGKIPQTTLTTTGYKIRILPGTYVYSDIDTYMENRVGTYQYPIIFQAENGANTVYLTGLNIKDSKYLYFINLNFNGSCLSGDGFHFEGCQYILFRNTEIYDGNTSMEVLKANQCKYFHIEDSDIHGNVTTPVNNTSVDFVAVQYGHILRNKIHHANNWCIYLKGGSGYFKVEGNEIYHGETEGGFAAGQSAGFSYMVSPWIHYEAYDIKFINNIVHDIYGSGMAVNGGYNILLAYNTLYRIGERSHCVEFLFGGRSVGDTPSISATYNAAGGWGKSTGGDADYIPNKNIYVYNNIIYNLMPYESANAQFSSRDETTPPSGTNVPNPSVGDKNIQIVGNIIWNGGSGSTKALGIGDSGEGRLSSGYVSMSDNEINTIEPQFTSVASSEFSLPATSNVRTKSSIAIPDFSWSDAPSTPAPPSGTLSNSVTKNRAGTTRSTPDHPGAY